MVKNGNSGTVARSPGLTDDFITEKLLPLCFYHPSKKRQALRIPVEEFPRALNFIRFTDGSAVISQTVYIEDGYFTHQYIFDEPIPTSIVPTLYDAFFLTSSDWEQLEELDSLPLLNELITDTAVASLPFDEMRLMQLVDLLKFNEKAYVILPDLHWVQPMLTWLFEMTEGASFGFTTYSREAIENKFINLVFLEKGSLDVCDLPNDFVFDFDSSKFSENLPS